MNRISDTFRKGKKVFIAFVTGGDPDIETTAKLIVAMEQAGADIIEIGIPFSDPIAEGPVILRASERALSSGCTVDKLFDMVTALRETVKIPLLFMTYANPVFGYGKERFLTRCSQSGIDGLIIPDTPFEEKSEFSEICRQCNVDLISMVAPTSKERAERIAKEAEGFLYCVSSLGVTGVRNSISTEIFDTISIAKKASKIPCAIGFGISTPEHAREMSQHADGVIVGSAIVKIVEKFGKDSIPMVFDYVASMKKAILE